MFFPIDTRIVFQQVEENKKCGDYEKGHEISGQLYKCNKIYDFCIRRQILDSEDKEIMLVARTARSPTGLLYYDARPYTTDIGQIKIYFDPRSKTMARCRIRQLYNSSFQGQLRVKAQITLIDTGDHMAGVGFHLIYDFPQTARYLTKLEPEVTICSLDLPDHLLMDQELNKLFMDTIKKRHSNSQYTIVIRSYRNGRYHVDLLNSSRQSFIDHIKSSYRVKFGLVPDGNSTGGSDASSDTVDSHESLHTYSRTLIKPPQLRFQTIETAHHRHRNYRGASHYFLTRIKEIQNSQPNRFAMFKRFFDVKLTIWEHPRDIYLIPRDPDYQKSHQDLLDDIKVYVEKHKLHEEDDSIYETVFHVGEKVIFRNRHVDQIGSWLRGVIIEVPKMTGQTWVDMKKSEVEKSKTEHKSRSTSSAYNIMQKYVYRVRSIDYGFENALSVGNIRRVLDKSIFTTRGPYSLRCRLFGVNPLYNDQDEDGKVDFSDQCKTMIDAWMREKILQEFRPSYFYALFQTKFKDLSDNHLTADGSMDITLFHRYETIDKSLEDIYLPSRKKKEITFACLNTYLIESGYATDDLGGNVSSNVDLDQLLINLLANRHEI